MSNGSSKLDELANQGEPVEEQPWGGWVNSVKDGREWQPEDVVVGGVLGIAENENGKYLELERRDGSTFNFGLPRYLANNYDLRELVGQVCAFACTDTQDVGQPSPMTVWQVYRYGGEFPDVEGLEAELELEEPDGSDAS